MLRVTRFPRRAEEAETLRVEGRLTRADLPRFQETCASLLDAGASLRLDLSGLQFADRAAVAALQGLRRRGASLEGASGFLDALLADAAS
jgi:ABC-type transporter Mla MlaB component